MSVYALTWLVVLLPAAAAAASYVSESARRAADICILGTLGSLVLSVIVLIYRLGHISQNPYQSVITFFTFSPGVQPQGLISDFHPQVGVLVDGLSAAIMPVVALVSLLVQVYSTAYMRHDAGYRRFFVLIALFTFSMLGLVASPNLFDTYLMWEGVGVCSYLLIGHWWHRPAAAAAAKKAFLVTRIGDLAFLLGIIITFTKLAPDLTAQAAPPGQDVNDPFNFLTLQPEWHRVAVGAVSGAGTRTLVVIACLVLVGAIGKSAQMPFHVWLPDAMEGPTPISALIHAATMVAAGVYLVARMYPLFLATPHVMTAVAMIGGVTAVFGAVVALAQTDIKRLIAYSTISHLGLMFTALGVGAFSAAMFHLVTHAWFKALLFLAAGNLIVAFNTQDLREMGGAWKRMRTTSLALFAGSCSAAGVVLFAGFWSKDSIIAGVLRNEFPGGGHVSRSAQALLIIAVAATSFLGAIYPFRMFFMAVAGTPARRRGFNPDRVREAPPAMLSPVVILGVLSVVFGFLGIEGARYTFNKFVYAGASPPSDGIGWGGMALGSSLALAGVAVAYALYLRGRGVSLVQRLGPLRDLVRDGFRIDDAYAWVVQRGVLALARLPVRVDDEITDSLALGTVDGIGTVAAETPRVQRGRIQGYGLGAVAGVLVVAAGVTLAATGHLPGVGAAR